MQVDEIWHAVVDEASDVDWYVKRTILGGIYSTTEVFMLTNSSNQRQSQSSGEGVGRRPRVEYQDEQALVLQASLRHVIKLGWTQAALIAGAREERSYIGRVFHG